MWVLNVVWMKDWMNWRRLDESGVPTTWPSWTAASRPQDATKPPVGNAESDIIHSNQSSFIFTDDIFGAEIENHVEHQSIR